MNINKLIKQLLALRDAGITDVFGEIECRKRIIMNGIDDNEDVGEEDSEYFEIIRIPACKPSRVRFSTFEAKI